MEKSRASSDRLVPGRLWDQIAGEERVQRWIQAGSGAAGARALRTALPWLPLSTDEVVWERMASPRAVVSELIPMLTALGVPRVYYQIQAVGLAIERLTELETLLLAFVQIEECNETAEEHSRQTVDEACELRRELLAACAWNLRDRRCSPALGRITQSRVPEELALDLSELAELVRVNEAAFSEDRSFSVSESSERALASSYRLRSETAFSTQRDKGPLSRAVFGLLMERAEELRAAGTYALRDAPHWARAFRPLTGIGRVKSKFERGVPR